MAKLSPNAISLRCIFCEKFSKSQKATFSAPQNLPNSVAQICALISITWCVLVSHVRLCDPVDCSLPGILQARILEWIAISFSMGCHSLLWRFFPAQGLNPGLPHCRPILYCLSHRGSPRILEWVAYPFSRGSS